MSTKPTNDEPKPIVLTMTIFPPRKGVRKVVVTGAPDGEMPLLLAGVFAERHTLIDQAFSGVLKREPQLVTLKEAKTAKSKSKGAAADDDDEQGDDDEATKAVAEASDQLVSADHEAEPIMAVMDSDLPKIEGDGLPTEAFGSDETNNEVGNDGEQD